MGHAKTKLDHTSALVRRASSVIILLITLMIGHLTLAFSDHMYVEENLLVVISVSMTAYWKQSTFCQR